MRQIKFCGKRIDNGEWVYGDLLHMNDGTFRIAEKTLEFTVVPESVGQFTEVHDDVGDNELYEGYVIKMYYGGEEIVGSIEYCGGGFILASDDFEDGFKLISELTENDGRFFWIPTAVIIGNMTDDKDRFII